MVQRLSVGGRAAVGTDAWACWLKGEGTEIIMNQSNAPGSIPTGCENPKMGTV
jgi:hypothetical protein